MLLHDANRFATGKLKLAAVMQRQTGVACLLADCVATMLMFWHGQVLFAFVYYHNKAILISTKEFPI